MEKDNGFIGGGSANIRPEEWVKPVSWKEIIIPNSSDWDMSKPIVCEGVIDTP